MHINFSECYEEVVAALYGAGHAEKNRWVLLLIA
jgi:hypothetical protein